MRLSRLLDPGVTVRGAGWQEVEIAALSADSRTVHPGTLFAAFPGSKADGRAFIDDAVRRGLPILGFDMQDTEEVDASGLGLLVNMQKRADELGVTLELLHVPKHIRHLLVLTRLEHLFVIVEE